MRSALVALVLPFAFAVALAAQTGGSIVEFPVNYPNQTSMQTGACHPKPGGSTHEITFNMKGGGTFWVTGQNYGQVVEVAQSGAMVFHPMPEKSGPHGIEFDSQGRLWVTLEFAGQVVRLDGNGKIVQTIDVGLACPTCAKGETLNPSPHGMGFDAADNLWFTGKKSGTIGRISPDGKITTFPLATVGSVPIYIRVANDGKTMWATELVGNAIARITADGTVTEFPIPTNNSRPIAIVPEPGGSNMWFTEEAGNRVAKIDPNGIITEYPLPLGQASSILAGLGFDSAGNLWVQQYVDQNNPTPANPSPAGADYVIRIDKSILEAAPSDLSQVPITYYKTPSTQTVMHRILQGPDGNIWFTELGVNKVGKLFLGK